MTILAYQLDSYLKSTESTVTAVDAENHAIQLDRTPFFPGGGGQPHDTGYIEYSQGVAQISRVKKIGAEIWHFIDAESALPAINERISAHIDWDRRYQLMRTHTAMHILCGVVYRDFGALVTGGDMDPLKGRMDFEFENLSRDLVQVIEAAVNREVQAAHEVRVKILPREEAFQIPDLIRTKINLLPPGITEIRTIELVGLDLQADGGTHVANTSEVGTMRIVDYKSKGKINKRIYVELD
jgi:misacylated tRNA(Ala) deacylase